MKVTHIAPRRAVLVLLALAAGGVIAACGSASGSSSSTTRTTAAAATGSSSSSSSGARSARRAQLVACLKQHGVTLPSRPPGAGGGAGGGGTGPNGGTGTGTTPRRFFFGGGGFAANPKVRAALQACGAKFGAGAQRVRGRISRTRINSYVGCVRKNGYDLPNPNFSGKGSIFPPNIRSNPKFQAASAKCQNLLVPPRSAPGGTSTAAGA